MSAIMNGYSLSPVQERMWLFHNQGLLHNNQLTWQVEGDMDPARLKKSFHWLVKRHEIMRTQFRIFPGMALPLQVISSPSEPVPQVIDLTATDKTLVPAKIAEIEKELLNKKYDPEYDSPADLILIKTGSAGNVLLLQTPALCSDTISLITLAGELMQHYNGHPTADDPYQYTQYADWHQAVLAESDRSAAAFWQQEAGTVNTTTQLPFTLRNNIYQHPEIAFNTTGTNDIGRQDVLHFCNKNNISPELFFLGTWKLLIDSYTGEDETISPGVLFDCRTHEAFKQIAGPIARLLPFGISISPGEPVADYLRKLQQQHLEIISWQDNFNWKHHTNNNNNPDAATAEQYLPVAFEYTDLAAAATEHNYTISDIKYTGDLFQLKLSCMLTAQSACFRFIYYKCLFTEGEIALLANRFKIIAGRILENPQITMTELSAISSAETDLVSGVFNNTTIVFPAANSVKQVFETRALKTPDEVAISSGTASLTCRELNEKANQLAHLLINEYRVKPDDSVIVKLKRSPEMIIALIGIAKTGAAYLPVDSNIPAGRFSYIVEDSRAAIVLTDEPGELPEQVLQVRMESSVLENQPVTNPALSVLPGANLYAIYTSGSTGQPKGVLVSNGSLLNYVNWFSSTYSIGANDSTLLFSSIAFDLCYTSLWSALLTGSRLYLLPDAEYLEPQELIGSLIDNRITYIKLTPSHFKLLTTDPALDEHIKKYNLRLVVLGGEEIVPDDIALIFQQRKDIVFVNHYGPTETTVGTAAFTIHEKEFETFRARPVIGKPVSNNHIYIIDSNMQLLAPGQTGEILVGGKGVANGYLHNEELTSEKFIPNPFIKDQTAYLTGDRGRWTSDGYIEFLGRKDHQVKLRGYRIELPEIEARLLSYTGIKTAVAVLLDTPAGKNIAAFYTAAARVSSAELRSHLEKILPAYMIPVSFIQTEKIPLTPNGKTDRKTLAALFYKQEEDEEQYDEPANPIEVKLQEIWRSVLAKERVGVKSNFFAIGGHSLKAVQMMSAVYKELQVKLELKDLFETPTIEGLAHKLAGAGKVLFQSIDTIPQADYYETTRAQKRLWYLAQLDREQVSYNMSSTYYFEGGLNKEIFEQAFTALVNRHEGLRTIFIDIAGEPWQKIQPAGWYGCRVSITDIRTENDINEKLREMIKRETTTPFDLATGPLFRASLVQVNTLQYVFIFTMHHIISDAWSLEVLLKDFLILYDAFSSGKNDPLTPLRIQYKEYAHWQNKQLSGEKFLQHKNYWTDEFSGQVPVLNFPADFPRPAVKSYNGDTAGFEITAAQTKGLKETGQRNGCTLFMTLLATVQALLHRYTGQEDIVTGSPIAGRDHADLENLVGLFLNNISIRCRFRGEDRFTDLLAQVKQKCLSAYEHQLYPFDLLTGDLNLKRDISRSPLFDVVVVLQNAQLNSDGEKEMENVATTKFDSGFRVSTIDIRIVFTEHDNGISCLIDYNTDIYKEETITAFFNNLSLLINAIMENEAIRIYDFRPAGVKAPAPVQALSTAFNF